jgi:hypothetical protein
MSWDRESEDWAQIKRGFAVGAALGAIVLAWLWLARPGDDALSSGGFNLPGAPGGAIPFDRKGQTGLSMVRIGDALDPAAGAAGPVSAAPADVQLSVGSAGAAGTAAGAPVISTAVPEAAASPAEMAGAGLPTDAAGFKNLGAQKGLLTAAFNRLIEHPRLLRALFNNTLVVDALMSRDSSQQNCSSPAALQAVLSNPQSDAMRQMMPVVQNALSHPEAAGAFAGSVLATRLMNCPSVQGLAKSPSGIMAVVQSNPAAVGILTDPRVAQAVADSPQAGGLLTGLESSLGSSSGASAAGGSSNP